MSDLISREELLNEINLLKESPWCNDDYTTVKLVRKDAIDVVERCVEKAPGVPQWISVKDRLPKKRTEVLAVISLGIMVVAWYDREWSYNGITLHNVTHWMPLPELPESEDEE